VPSFSFSETMSEFKPSQDLFPPLRPEYDYTEDEVVKYLEHFCYEQVGCRMIQRMMEETKN